MIRIKAPEFKVPDTTNWTDADWEDFMFLNSMQREEEKKSGFIDDPAFVDPNVLKPFPAGCQHVQHTGPAFIVIPEGKLYRHVCPGCKTTSYWKS